MHTYMYANICLAVNGWFEAVWLNMATEGLCLRGGLVRDLSVGSSGEATY